MLNLLSLTRDRINAVYREIHKRRLLKRARLFLNSYVNVHKEIAADINELEEACPRLVEWRKEGTRLLNKALSIK